MPSRSKRASGAAFIPCLGDRGFYGVSEHCEASSGHTRHGAWEGTLAFSNISLLAFRPETVVDCLGQLVQMHRVDSEKTIERFAVHGATEHGPRKLLVYNQHQPSSEERPFPTNQRIDFCKAILRDAIAFCNAEAKCCGFVFGGDANCSMAPWTTALLEVGEWRLTFQEPQFLHGVGRKGGDLMVAASVCGVDMAIYENRCKVKGRERQHDCMFFKWSCRDFPRAEAPVWPSRQVRPRTQEPDTARGSSEPASGVAPGVIVIEDTEERPETHTLEADEISSLGSADINEEASKHDDEDGASEYSSGDYSEEASKHDDEDGASEHSDEAGASDHADEDGASSHTKAPGDGGGAKHFDELGAIGFALAKSASLLPEFSTCAHSRDCINAAWMKPMTGACTEADKDALMTCMMMFFTRKPVLQSTPPRQNSDHARVLKSQTEIQEAWQLIFERRRLVEPDDRQSIGDPEQLAKMWTTWQREWFAKQLTEAQWKKKWHEKTSIFNAWCWNTLGGQHFVMALWQTGMIWAPWPDLLNTNFNGAAEHVATHFASWVRRLARSVARHKANPLTDEARIRSGTAFRQHGMTPQQVKDREERRIARRDYYMTVRLANKLHAEKGKAWTDMSFNEQWWLYEYWNGNLRKAMEEAEAKCHRVQAPRFRMLPEVIS